MPDPLYALILAGGSGERFWPLSRRARPKQLLAPVGDRTLLQGTLDRLDGLVPPERILILTNRDQEPAVRQLCPQLPSENIVAEPAKRDTAAAIALGVAWIALRDPAATMIVLPADHLIKDTRGFQRTLETAAHAARETGELVTIGIRPTWACPGFGYIELGEPTDTEGVHAVARFREKPGAELAETFLRAGQFRWNAGMFIWTVPSIMSALERYQPELGAFVSGVRASGNFDAALAGPFAELPKISIDYAVMEKAGRVLCVEAGFDWDDVGGWAAIAKYLTADENENRSRGPLVALDSAHNIAFSNTGKTIALLGVNDLIVIETADALLVCPRHEAERIKELVARVPPALQ